MAAPPAVETSRSPCALILAAGEGTRLRPLTDDLPKVLVEVGGKPLLERQLAVCAAAGLEEAIVVTGFAHETLAGWLADAELPLQVQAVFNPAFSSHGNAWSVYAARHLLAGRSFVKFDGDLVLDPAILAALLAAEDDSALVVDSQVALDEEAMKVKLGSDGRVQALGKELSLAESTGESIGVEKIAAAAAPLLFDAIEQLVARDGEHQAYYEDAYQRMVKAGWRLGALSTNGRAWCEVDDHDDLRRAQALFGEQR